VPSPLTDDVRRLKIHYHSDCEFFAGCENMLANLCSSPVIQAEFAISFSYRDSARYREGVRTRMNGEFPLYPLAFPDPSSVLPAPATPRTVRRIMRLLSRMLFTCPLLVYEVARLARLFRRLAPNLVHINNGGYPAALSPRAAALAAYLARVPSVMMVNNLALGYDHPARWLGYALDRLIARSVGCFITGSIAAAERLQRVLRLPSSRCRAIQTGVSLPSTSETVEQTRRRLGLEGFGGLLFAVVGVLEPRKGHHVLLEALCRVRMSQPESMRDIRVVLAGQGPLERSLRQGIADAGMEQHCFLIGQEPNITNLLAVVDVLIAPSVGYEDFPNATLEAMGSGKAVIASRLAGAIEQVVEGETGLLVAPGNSEELAEAICRVCKDRNLAGELGRNGLRRFHALFTAERAVGRYLELYRSLMEAQ
jgi:glycosyltransferase involved in cell wall biosynthesis